MASYLAGLKVPLVQVRGQWVELRPEQIEQAIQFWEKRGAGQAHTLSMPEALRLALSLEPAKVGAGLPITEVAAEGWIADLMQKLAQGDQIRALRAPDAFRGTLRHYQASGLSWLAFLRQWGLGACLADDMGLGKTVEVAALLLHEREKRNGNHKPALVICPTSVVSNWQRELSRFAPDLRVLVHHGAARKKTGLAEQTARHELSVLSAAVNYYNESEYGPLDALPVVSLPPKAPTHSSGRITTVPAFRSGTSSWPAASSIVTASAGS